MALPPFRPTPHRPGAMLTPLSLTPLQSALVRPRSTFGRAHMLPRWMRIRGWVVLAAAVPVALAVAASSVDGAEERQRTQVRQRALSEAESITASVVRPLRVSGSAPDAERLEAITHRVDRLSRIASVHNSRIQAQVVAPGVVAIITRAPLMDGGGTAVCMAALRWTAEALPPDSFGPRCVVQSA